MKLYKKLIAPVRYYPGQSYDAKTEYLEDPVVWYPEEMHSTLVEKYTYINNHWDILGFKERYEEYAEEPKFKKLKVPEKCGECKSCNVAITRSPYCRMEAASPINSQMDISSIYVNMDSRPAWCPIIKVNDELDRMPFEKRAELEKLITVLSSLLGGEDLWD